MATTLSRLDLFGQMTFIGVFLLPAFLFLSLLSFPPPSPLSSVFLCFFVRLRLLFLTFVRMLDTPDFFPPFPPPGLGKGCWPQFPRFRDPRWSLRWKTPPPGFALFFFFSSRSSEEVCLPPFSVGQIFPSPLSSFCCPNGGILILLPLPSPPPSWEEYSHVFSFPSLTT